MLLESDIQLHKELQWDQWTGFNIKIKKRYYQMKWFSLKPMSSGICPVHYVYQLIYEKVVQIFRKHEHFVFIHTFIHSIKFDGFHWTFRFRGRHRIKLWERKRRMKFWIFHRQLGNFIRVNFILSFCKKIENCTSEVVFGTVYYNTILKYMK